MLRTYDNDTSSFARRKIFYSFFIRRDVERKNLFGEGKINGEEISWGMEEMKESFLWGMEESKE